MGLRSDEVVRMPRCWAWLFPGQGSQYVGMGKDLVEAYPAARETFAAANAILGFDLALVCFSGPEETLRETRYTQLAILTHSVAVARVLEGRAPRPELVAGHSVGEYAALVACGTLRFDDALRLVRARAEAMFQSGLARPGGMVAVIGMPEDNVAPLLAEAGKAGTIAVANYNSPVQVVLSGEAAAVDLAAQSAPSFGAKRAIRLNVSGAFHSPLMEAAREGLARALQQVLLAAPRMPLVSNVTGASVATADEIRDLLGRQLTSPVMWRQSVGFMVSQGVDGLLEVGPGNVLCGLAKRIVPQVRCSSCTDLGTVEAFLAEVQTR